VLVARGTGTEKYRHVVAAVDPFHLHSKPAGLDSSIVAHALRFTQPGGATLAVVHCYNPPDYFGIEAVVGIDRRDTAAGRREALEQLVEKSGLPKSAARLETGGSPDTLLKRMAQSGEADLIVMDALARGRIEEFFIGSTAERVLHGGAADVLAVKPTPAG
jgi:universal stress protein E